MENQEVEESTWELESALGNKYPPVIHKLIPRRNPFKEGRL